MRTSGRCHQWGLLRRWIPLLRQLHWSHSILSERDFLSEWRAIELASEVATDLGFFSRATHRHLCSTPAQEDFFIQGFFLVYRTGSHGYG